MKQCNVTVVSALFLLSLIIQFNVGFSLDKQYEEKVTISSECAAVVLVGGGALGGVTAISLAPTLLGVLGFTGIGVAGNSFAAWWQSTMPFLASGSFFATLQSIAMAGTGMGTFTLGSALGGAASAKHLKDLCEVVDSVDPNSATGSVISTVLVAVQKSPKVEDLVSKSKVWKAMLSSLYKDWVNKNF